MHPWMTGMCKQRALNGAFGRCQPAQWSPLLNAREKGHSSPNCSTKPELPGLYLAWLASMTQTSKALMEVKEKKRAQKHREKQRGNNMHETEMKRRLVWNHFCDNERSNPPRFPTEFICSAELNKGTNSRSELSWSCIIILAAGRVIFSCGCSNKDCLSSLICGHFAFLNFTGGNSLTKAECRQLKYADLLATVNHQTLLN